MKERGKKNRNKYACIPVEKSTRPIVDFFYITLKK